MRKDPRRGREAARDLVGPDGQPQAVRDGGAGRPDRIGVPRFSTRIGAAVGVIGIRSTAESAHTGARTTIPQRSNVRGKDRRAATEHLGRDQQRPPENECPNSERRVERDQRQPHTRRGDSCKGELLANRAIVRVVRGSRRVRCFLRVRLRVSMPMVVAMTVIAC